MDDIDMIRPVQAWYVDCASNLFKHCLLYTSDAADD